MKIVRQEFAMTNYLDIQKFRIETLYELLQHSKKKCKKTSEFEKLKNVFRTFCVLRCYVSPFELL